MSRARRGAIAIAASVGLLLAAAAPAMAGDVATSSASKSPVGDWQTRTNGVKQTITFTKDGEVFGDAGCNRFTGGYETGNDGAITIGPLATTLMMCQENVMNAEATFLVRIQAAVAYNATAKRLQIFAPKDLVTFRKA
jgi:heat shock protein HslJ